MRRCRQRERGIRGEEEEAVMRDTSGSKVSVSASLTSVLTFFGGLLLFVIVAGSVGGQIIPPTAKADPIPSFRVGLVDGLYLFQPYSEAGDLLYAEKSKDTLSPLFIVSNGRLIDPLVLAHEMGIHRFLTTYVKGKVFNVFSGSELTGQLRDINLRPLDTCHTGEFFPDLEGKGTYLGKTPTDYGGRGVVITPRSFGTTSRSNPVFRVTDEDRTRVTELVRRELIPRAADHLNKRLEKEGKKERYIGEAGRSGVVRIEAFDLDGDGKKDLLGVYRFTGKYSKKEGMTSEFVFVLLGTGKLEMVSSFVDMSPAFIWGGIIDVNQDGRYEIIIQTRKSGNQEEGIDGGKRITILHHTPGGWAAIYESALTGCY